MNVTHEGMQRIKAWRRGVAQCMNNGSHETETGGETKVGQVLASCLVRSHPQNSSVTSVNFSSQALPTQI